MKQEIYVFIPGLTYESEGPLQIDRIKLKASIADSGEELTVYIPIEPEQLVEQNEVRSSAYQYKYEFGGKQSDTFYHNYSDESRVWYGRFFDFTTEVDGFKGKYSHVITYYNYDSDTPPKFANLNSKEHDGIFVLKLEKINTNISLADIEVGNYTQFYNPAISGLQNIEWKTAKFKQMYYDITQDADFKFELPVNADILISPNSQNIQQMTYDYNSFKHMPSTVPANSFSSDAFLFSNYDALTNKVFILPNYDEDSAVHGSSYEESQSYFPFFRFSALNKSLVLPNGLKDKKDEFVENIVKGGVTGNDGTRHDAFLRLFKLGSHSGYYITPNLAFAYYRYLFKNSGEQNFYVTNYNIESLEYLYNKSALPFITIYSENLRRGASVFTFIQKFYDGLENDIWMKSVHLHNPFVLLTNNWRGDGNEKHNNSTAMGDNYTMVAYDISNGKLQDSGNIDVLYDIPGLLDPNNNIYQNIAEKCQVNLEYSSSLSYNNKNILNNAANDTSTFYVPYSQTDFYNYAYGNQSLWDERLKNISKGIEVNYNDVPDDFYGSLIHVYKQHNSDFQQITGDILSTNLISEKSIVNNSQFSNNVVTLQLATCNHINQKYHYVLNNPMLISYFYGIQDSTIASGIMTLVRDYDNTNMVKWYAPHIKFYDILDWVIDYSKSDLNLNNKGSHSICPMIYSDTYGLLKSGDSYVYSPVNVDKANLLDNSTVDSPYEFIRVLTEQSTVNEEDIKTNIDIIGNSSIDNDKRFLDVSSELTLNFDLSNKTEKDQWYILITRQIAGDQTQISFIGSFIDSSGEEQSIDEISKTNDNFTAVLIKNVSEIEIKVSNCILYGIGLYKLNLDNSDINTQLLKLDLDVAENDIIVNHFKYTQSDGVEIDDTTALFKQVIFPAALCLNENVDLLSIDRHKQLDARYFDDDNINIINGSKENPLYRKYYAKHYPESALYDVIGHYTPKSTSNVLEVNDNEDGAEVEFYFPVNDMNRDQITFGLEKIYIKD